MLAFPVPDDPIGALVAWSREVLRVPAGHPRAGKPMDLPSFAVEFLRAGWTAHESALCIARNNAKSAICAVLALAFLAGPLRRPGWRGAVASVSKEKAAELRAQIEAIALASDLEGLRFQRAPYPGKVESATGILEILSSDRTAGHSSSFDPVVVDETGLMPERSRGEARNARDLRLVPAVGARPGRARVELQGDGDRGNGNRARRGALGIAR